LAGLICAETGRAVPVQAKSNAAHWRKGKLFFMRLLLKKDFLMERIVKKTVIYPTSAIAR
jgi:hypothetical protein